MAMDLATETSRPVRSLAGANEIFPPAIWQNEYNRDAESIVFNIATAEGRVANSSEYLRFMSIARGATFKLESRLLLDVRRKILQQSDAEAALKLCDELAKNLNALVDKLAADERTWRLNNRIRPLDFRREN